MISTIHDSKCYSYPTMFLQELNPAIADASGNNILHYAAMKSLTSYEINKILTKLRKSHGDLSDLVRRQNSIGNTPLHQAVEHGSLDTAKLFISYDEELLKCRNNAGESPLDISLRVGKDSQTAMLLSQSSPDLYPDNILSRIVESNMHALLESLFQATSDSSMAKGTASVLGYSLTLPSLEAIRIRISRYNDISPETGISLVHDSIIERKREILSVFLGRSDVDLTLADKEGNTALHLSLLPKNYSPDIVCSLINWFALKKKLSDGTARQTAKQLKLVGDHIPLFSIFVSAILNKQNREGETPLLMLFQCTSTMGEKMTLHCIEQFIQFGADVTAFDSKGNTALFYAVYQGNTKAAVLLRIAGASTAVENNDGLTPIDLALEREDEEMTCILTAEPDALKGGGKSKKRP